MHTSYAKKFQRGGREGVPHPPFRPLPQHMDHTTEQIRSGTQVFLRTSLPRNTYTPNDENESSGNV